MTQEKFMRLLLDGGPFPRTPEPCRFLLEVQPGSNLERFIDASIQQDYQEDWFEDEWLGGVYR